MSNTARKARKRDRFATLDLAKHISDSQVRQEYIETVLSPTTYQHPSREGIPYGHSKPWSIDRDIADMHRQMGVTQAIIDAAPDLWRAAVSK